MNYSTAIGLIKVTLPLFGVLGVIAALVWDYEPNKDVSEQFSENDKEFASAELSASAPEVNIEDDEGDQFRIRANEVIADDIESNKVGGEEIGLSAIIDGKEWSISAEKGSADRESKNFIFTQNVEAVLEDNFTLKTEELQANIENKTLRSPARSLIESDKISVSGDEFTLTGEEGERVLTLNGDVQGELYEQIKLPSSTEPTHE